MIESLSHNPLLILFIVASLGYLFGTINIKGYTLGVAAVLFMGLAFGAANTSFHIPEIVINLGLILFVYSIGLSSGPAFFKSYKKNGFRDFLFLISMLLLSGLIAGGLFMMLDLSAAAITGAYAGSTTNTPALAGVIDYINNTNAANSEQLLNDAVIGYSFSYPMGVLGAIFAIIIMEKFLGIDYEKENEELKQHYPLEKNLSSTLLRITHPDVIGKELRELQKKYGWEVVYGRIFRGEKCTLSNWDTVLAKDDLILIVGTKENLAAATAQLGEKSTSSLYFDRTKFDVRRIFVSKQKFVGQTIASLNLSKNYNAIITRIRRGDVDMLAQDETVLELGDRIRFVAKREELMALSEYFGDSYTNSNKVNLFSYGLGIGLGLILGSIELQLGPDISFKLGYAGGPLIVGLFLGTLRRTGPIVWTLPYGATVTLQQIGLILLLAGIGVNSGGSLVESFNATGGMVFLASIAISMVTALAILFVGYKVVKMPFSLLLGIVSNQPAILDFAVSRTKNSIPQFGYTMMFPIASVMKIVIAQILFVLLV